MSSEARLGALLEELSSWPVQEPLDDDERAALAELGLSAEQVSSLAQAYAAPLAGGPGGLDTLGLALRAASAEGGAPLDH